MSTQNKRLKASLPRGLRPAKNGLLQRKSASSLYSSVKSKKDEVLKRDPVNAAPINAVPPIVDTVLNSPGQSLDTGIRATMEPRFGHDFSQVRIHSDDQAADSARAVNALAYTVGRDVVFSAGQYAPHTSIGQHLIAHELAHTIQQKNISHGGLILPGPTGNTYEQEAKHAAKTLSSGAKISSSISIPTLQRFAPEGHRKATIESMKGSFSAEEIGLIYEANWERDFSQGPAKIANVVTAWKAVKLTAKQNKGTPSSDAIEHFKKAVQEVLSTGLAEALGEGLLASYGESLGGYRYWEHMDNPGFSDAEYANARWYGVVSSGEMVYAKTGPVPGYILDSRAYIKDNLVAAVDAYRVWKHGRQRMATSINNWKGANPPSDYGQKKDTRGVVHSRDPIAQETTETAIKAGAKSSGATGLPFSTTDHLGRAMHAMQDFFAHSNWLEMAKELKAGHTPTQTLHTGTFEMADKLHALGHKLITLVNNLLQDYDLLLKVYGLKSEKEMREQPNPITMKSWSKPGELYDVYSAGHTIHEQEQKGKARIEDFIASKSFLHNLSEKGRHMMERAEKEAPATGHANLAKDAPEPGKDYEGAILLATAADKLVFAPLRTLMDNPDDEATKRKLTEQLGLVDAIIAPPSTGHPLLDKVKAR